MAVISASRLPQNQLRWSLPRANRLLDLDDLALRIEIDEIPDGGHSRRRDGEEHDLAAVGGVLIDHSIGLTTLSGTLFQGRHELILGRCTHCRAEAGISGPRARI